MKNRKREICTSGTVRDEDGNILIYSANDRGDRGNVGIIRSPLRASILPDYKWVTRQPWRCVTSSSASSSLPCGLFGGAARVYDFWPDCEVTRDQMNSSPPAVSRQRCPCVWILVSSRYPLHRPSYERVDLRLTSAPQTAANLSCHRRSHPAWRRVLPLEASNGWPRTCGSQRISRPRHLTLRTRQRRCPRGAGRTHRWPFDMHVDPVCTRARDQ